MGCGTNNNDNGTTSYIPQVQIIYIAINLLGTTLQDGRSRVRLPLRTLKLFNLLNPSGRTTAVVFTQNRMEMTLKDRSTIVFAD
jgi:hypothetical protein